VRGKIDYAAEHEYIHGPGGDTAGKVEGTVGVSGQGWVHKRRRILYSIGSPGSSLLDWQPRRKRCCCIKCCVSR
jgi:hypothetical protein